MDCLHRFCQSCIEQSLVRGAPSDISDRFCTYDLIFGVQRAGQKQCPTCRVHCASRRNLRRYGYGIRFGKIFRFVSDHVMCHRDPNFDKLIALVHPDLNEADAKQDEMVQQLIMTRAPSVNWIAQNLQKGALMLLSCAWLDCLLDHAVSTTRAGAKHQQKRTADVPRAVLPNRKQILSEARSKRQYVMISACAIRRSTVLHPWSRV